MMVDPHLNLPKESIVHFFGGSYVLTASGTKMNASIALCCPYALIATLGS